MKLRSLVRALGVLLICLSLYWVWLDIHDWMDGAASGWHTVQRVFVRFGSGFAGGLLCLFFPEVKLQMFRYGNSSSTSKRRRFSSRLQPKSKYDYDESEVIELDSERRSERK